MKKIKKHLDKIAVASFVALMPVAVFAQTASNTCLGAFKNNKTVGGLFEYVLCLAVDTIVPLLFAIALVVFLWGMVQFIMNAENEEKREKYRNFMLWGIVGLAVMSAIWGLVAIFTKTFDIDSSKAPVLPTLKK